VNFADLLVTLDGHFSPKPSEILCRFKFNKRDQMQSETIAEFVAQLRKLSENCNFGTQLDFMLRDRLVCGIRDEDIQRKLLCDPTLTLTTAMDIALAGEAALRQASEIRRNNEHSDSTVNLVKSRGLTRNFSKSKQSNQQKKPCYRCGMHHPQGECKFLKVTCHYCKKIGHIAKVCRAKTQARTGPPVNRPTGRCAF